MSDLGPGTVAAVATTAVLVGLPLQAVPIFGCLGAPFALVGLPLLALAPTLQLRADLPWPRRLVGGAGLLLAGGANVALVVMWTTRVFGVVGGRDPQATVLSVAAVGASLLVWGALVAATAVGRGARLGEAVAAATPLVATGPLSGLVLATFAALGLPMGT
ncbi:MAG: hypothetical protein KC656_10500 [Myxococcales bacterium]|nr:hypothetical protein [Myxococcales bacterium]MCA9568266.1 hypothetical protein [Myxococcales bacterium]